jgi:2'-5' RNA ligase
LSPKIGFRNAVVVPVPEAATLVDAWRERTCNAKASAGMPPHITLLFPFVPAARLDERVIGQLAAIIGSTPSFRVVLRETGRLRGAAVYLYLAPDPAEPFIRLTEAIVDGFPGHRPYDGEFDQVVPHLTVAQGDDSLLHEAERDVVGGLPIESVVNEALLLAEDEPNWGRCQVRARLPFARAD